MSKIPVIINPVEVQGLAHEILATQWGRVYTWLIECEKCERRGWYIDDRADPYNFKHLLSWALPDTSRKIYGQRYYRTKIGLKYIYANHEDTRQD